MTTPTRTPQNAAQAPQRPAQSRARTGPGTKTQRAEVSAARQHAEAWYAHLRRWETVHGWRYARTSSGGASRFIVISGRIASSGSLDLEPLTSVLTPIGPVDERLVGHHITLDPHRLLPRIRDGGGLASLVHSSGHGWASPSARAQALALAVLDLADRLGDVDARALMRPLERFLHDPQVHASISSD